MTTARILTRFQLTSTTNTLRIIHSVDGTKDLVLTADEYFYHSTDNDVTTQQLDICRHIEDLIAAACAAVSSCTIGIYGVDETDATLADGRMRFRVDSGTIQFDFSNSTLDPRLLGFPEASTTKPAAGSADFDSELVHRRGWYPQTTPTRYMPYPFPSVLVDFSVGGWPQGVDEGEWESTEIEFVDIGAPLIRTKAAEIPAWATLYKLTQNDENCGFDRWATDTARAIERWRYYEDATSTTIAGTYFFGPYSPLWTDPLSAAVLADDQAEAYNVIINGRSVPI